MQVEERDLVAAAKVDLLDGSRWRRREEVAVSMPLDNLSSVSMPVYWLLLHGFWSADDASCVLNVSFMCLTSTLFAITAALSASTTGQQQPCTYRESTKCLETSRISSAAPSLQQSKHVSTVKLGHRRL